MCGIVGAVAQRDVAPILLEGLKRLEYRGYDSAGVAVINSARHLERIRTLGKVVQLKNALEKTPLTGALGIAHTRWATHGKPSELNAHPHVSGEKLALVHNGIIENYEVLKGRLVNSGYAHVSDTDTEVVAHLIHYHLDAGNDILSALRKTTGELQGAYALGVIFPDAPDRLYAVRSGSPLVVGLGIGENFIASDHLALFPLVQEFIYLEEGDTAEIGRDFVHIYAADGTQVQRKVHKLSVNHEVADRGNHRHFMVKEIFEQPKAITETLEGRLGKENVLQEAFGAEANQIFDQVKSVQIVACGTSYHAGMVARYWFEEIAGIPCQVEIASEFRYRQVVVLPGTLFITISQSGETADTLAALRNAKQSGYLATLAICNVPDSALVRESDLVLMTRAGVEIGVASTKAFTTQLTALLLLVGALGRRHKMTHQQELELVSQLKQLPSAIHAFLEYDDAIKQLSEKFTDKRHALFLARGLHYPIALEGALKLKEISYIHAEAYPAGELKHGPLALVDENMPIITVAPNDLLLEKLKSNLEEVRARGGQLFVFADGHANMKSSEGTHVVEMPSVPAWIAPILYTIPLQLLAYHVAVLKGTDVDQPRNLAKSVTVE